VSTVRRWIRAVRIAGLAQWLRERAVGWIARVAPDVLAGLGPERPGWVRR